MSSNKNDNKEGKKDNNRYKEKIKCEVCEVVYTKCNKAHHEKTKRHQNAELKEKVESIKSKDTIKAINEIKKKAMDEIKKILE